MTFHIATNPETYGTEWTAPLWWTGTGVTGPVNAHLKWAAYPDAEAAAAAFAEIPEAARRFYSLAIVEG